MVVRKDDYRHAGGLDAKFFAHNEEIDLCWRMLLLGRRICCVPSSTVYHLGGGTLPSSNPRKTFLNFRNNLTMLYKNLRGIELWNVMLVRLFLDYLAAFQALILKRNTGEFRAIISARMAFWKWRRSFNRERRDMNILVKTIPERRKYSVLWQYYIRGRKRFMDIEQCS